MKQPAPRTVAVVLALISAMVLLSGGRSSAAPPASQPASQPDLLAGPSVENTATSEVSRMGPQNQVADQRNKALPMQRWIRALRTIDLAPEQDSAIKSVIQDWNTARNDWFAAHNDELKSLRDRYNASRESGKPDRSLADKLQALQSSAPKLEDYQQKIWDDLTPDQQSALREKLNTPQQRRDRDPEEPTAPRQSDDPMSDTAPMSDSPMNSAGSSSSQPSSSNRDAAAERRLSFLHNHQSASAPGAPATPDERTFHFRDDS
ncbi:MAG TPA: hypothetical protein VG711_00275 [Phycisphaerales bacterium]|nr:hypothetical protein [Phycisphaerales bacterium]